MSTPAPNSSPSGASLIDQCGTQYNGTTQGGYAPFQNASPSLGDLDGNSSTTCPSSFGGNCGLNGNDVPFVINNPSYFTFCATSDGTFNINFDVGTCTQPLSGAQGSQMAILLGSATSLTLNQVAPNPMLPSSPIWTSSDFSLAAGQCAYLVVDVFAGDQCTYSYTLNNIGGGCVLPIELIHLGGQNEKGYNRLFWATATEKDNAYFTIEKSPDGINFNVLSKVNGAGTSYTRIDYEYVDDHPYEGITYYQLSQTDYDGTTKKLGIIAVDNKSKIKDIEFVPNPVSENGILKIPAYKEENISISIEDITGKIIESKNVTLDSGTNTFELNFSSLEKGLYFIHISSRTKNQYIKVARE